MQGVHVHDPALCPARLLTNDEVGRAAKRAQDRMREYQAAGELHLADVCAHARDRMLDVLATRLPEEAA